MNVEKGKGNLLNFGALQQIACTLATAQHACSSNDNNNRVGLQNSNKEVMKIGLLCAVNGAYPRVIPNVALSSCHCAALHLANASCQKVKIEILDPSSADKLPPATKASPRLLFSS
jgi:hypothetical protein